MLRRFHRKSRIRRGSDTMVVRTNAAYHLRSVNGSCDCRNQRQVQPNGKEISKSDCDSNCCNQVGNSSGLYLIDLIKLIIDSGPNPTATVQPTGTNPSQHGILNDSDLAAREMTNGDRRVFFQENAGNIREAVYLRSNNEWSTSRTIIAASDAKMHTPIAAIAFDRLNFTQESIQVDFFQESTLAQDKILTLSADSTFLHFR